MYEYWSHHGPDGRGLSTAAHISSDSIPSVWGLPAAQLSALPLRWVIVVVVCLFVCLCAIRVKEGGKYAGIDGESDRWINGVQE